MMKNIEKETEEFIRNNRMIGAGDTVIAGVSGGADSICLLFVLWRLQKKLGYRVKVCHVNHGLRGEEADADQRYVEELCRNLGVPCRIFFEDVESIAKKRKQSCEEAGRMVRREAFERMCREDGGTKIATAHHRDDNAETILLNLARGTGLRGLCGILPVSGKWIRPLLATGREQIERYLNEQNIMWCTDVTNEQDEFTRNRIRHHVLPVLEQQVNPAVVRHLNELSVQSREIWEYLEKGAGDAWEKCVTVKESGAGRRAAEICVQDFREEMRAVQNRLIHRCIAYVLESEKDIESVHIAEVRKLFDRQPGKQIDLPADAVAVRNSGAVAVYRQPERDRGKEEMCTAETELAVPGETPVPGTGIRIRCSFVEHASAEQAREIPQKSYTKWIDYDIIKYGLTVRTRRPGDFFTVNKEGGKQKLKSYFVNEKISREEREQMLLIADGSHIVWIPGRRMSRTYQIGENTGKILEIKFTEENENGRDNQNIDSGR